MMQYKTYVPSISSSSYSNKEDRVLVIADGLLINNCETVCPEEIDGAHEPIGEQCLDLDPQGTLLVPPPNRYDEVVVVALPEPFFIPMPLRLHLLDSIRADFMLYLFFSNQ